MARAATKFGPVHSVPSYTVKVQGEHGCACFGSSEYVDTQVAAYLSSRPNGCVQVWYSEHCAACSGSGRAGKNRRTLSWKPCPVCKGKPDTYPDLLLRTVLGPEATPTRSL